MRIDTNALIEQTNIADVIGRYIKLQREGAEHVGCCPFHNDKSPSLKVNPAKRMYKCFGCGAGGDVLDFLMRMGRTFKEAVAEVQSGIGTGDVSPEVNSSSREARPNSWRQIKPPGPAKLISHYKRGAPSRVWAYHNAAGEVWGYACRFDTTDGKKDILPYCYATDGERYEWRWMGFEKPRPVYNFHLLTMHPTATVVLVEGEKTADAVQAQFDPAKLLAITWLGGANGIRATDWQCLDGRTVVAWPDNDWSHAYGKNHSQAGEQMPWYEQPGNAAMLAILGMCRPKKTKWVHNPDGMPCGWDAADKDWQPGELSDYLKKHMGDVPVPFVEAPEPEPEPEPQIEHDYDVPADEPGMPDDDELPQHHDDDHFRFLGYEKTETGVQACYFYANAPKSVIKLTPSSMSKSNLMQLAPVQWWEMSFPGKRSLDLDAAVNYLIQRTFESGVFSEKWIRGRGAWIDGGKVVIHAGDRLVVDGRPTRLRDFHSKFIYEIGEPLSFETDGRLPVKEANRLMGVLELVNWEREVNARLLAGWIVVAPICGALKWRPHIWVTGAAGSGKSWVMLNVIRRLLGDNSIAVQGETSEAGLRQTLKHDAIPVVYDEAEGEDRRAQERMQSVLALMRVGSSSDGGIMAKGTSGGSAKTFRNRSCFAFASIAVQVAQQSDRSRVTILGIKKPHPEQGQGRWRQLQELYNEVITDDFAAGLRARTISLLPVILKNADTFSNAVAAELGEQRAGDQIGTLLAGAYSLYSDGEITFKQAVEFIRGKDWSEDTMSDGSRDEIALLNHLLDHITGIVSSAGRQDRTVGELVQVAANIKSDWAIGIDNANDTLKRLGLKVDAGHIVISNSAQAIKKLLENTPWSRNHNKILMRIDGAEGVASAKFASGTQTRAVRIPLKVIFGSSDEGTIFASYGET